MALARAADNFRRSRDTWIGSNQGLRNFAESKSCGSPPSGDPTPESPSPKKPAAKARAPKRSPQAGLSSAQYKRRQFVLGLPAVSNHTRGKTPRTSPISAGYETATQIAGFYNDIARSAN